MWSKLDLVLLNPIAMESPWPILTEFKGPGISDHCIIWVNIQDQFKGLRKPFKFLNVWANHIDSRLLCKLVGTCLWRDT